VLVAFLGIIFFMVYSAFQQRVDLVTSDYYAQEVKYQQRIEQIHRMEALEQPISIKQQNQALALQFPAALQGQQVNGQVQLFRPSDARFDKQFDLALNNQGQQQLSTSGLLKGHYKVKILFEAAGQQYYSEQALFIH